MALPHIKCVCLLLFRSGLHRQKNIITDKLKVWIPMQARTRTELERVIFAESKREIF